jgi:hypothetical protein
MKFDIRKMMVGVGLTGFLALPAGAELVAGWDFSNLAGDSATVPVGQAANYTIQATASALNVSGDVVASTMRPGASVRDDAGLQGGINGFRNASDPTFPAGTTSFGGGALLGLTARGPASLEFDTSLPATPTNEWWVVSLGAAAIAHPTAGASDETQIDISFGDTCASASLVASVSVSPADSEVAAFLAPATSAGGCVVLGLDGTSVQPLIDNVALSTVAVPEPAFAGLLIAGVVGLFGLAGRRV